MQHFLDLQDSLANLGDSKWGSDSSPTQSHSSSAAASNVDRVLFQDLVEIVPLVQSLIDRKASSSFTRRASVTYTKTPSRDSLAKKVPNRNAAQSIPARKKKESNADSVLSFSSRGEKEQEELDALRAQLEDLQGKLSEKDELLKSAEVAKSQVSEVQVSLDEVKFEAAQRDSVIRASQQQLSDIKITLADKQAALEKLQWEAMTSNKSVEKLQGELHSLQGEIKSFMILFESLVKTGLTACTEDYDALPSIGDPLLYIDDWDETQMRKMEAARKAYEAAVVAAKEKRDEESIAAAASARLQLRSVLMGIEALIELC